MAKFHVVFISTLELETFITFLRLPLVDPPSPNQYGSTMGYISLLIQNHKPHVKNAITKLMSSHSAESNSSNLDRVVGFFVDMFCTSMIDVANELDITSLCSTYHSWMPKTPAEFIDLGTELSIPGFVNSVPPPVLPTAVLNKKGDAYSWYLSHARRYTETKGIVVNTFRELERHALDSLDTNQRDLNQYESVIRWPDDQPSSSVMLLCFGSMGSLSGPQVREIAYGLERAGVRFIWALREPPKSQLDLPSDHANVEDVLPNGFLERTRELGMVCGWIPQAQILAHQSIGGFISHCGWNSILESLWYGVPIATWPIYAEQQMNAFEMVKELGLVIEIRLDYREGSDLVMGEEVDRSIKRLMNGGDVVRGRVKEMREKGRIALMKNGSSYQALGVLIRNLVPKI
ncbi:unnamed protein product [Malus baccata var. baccata]